MSDIISADEILQTTFPPRSFILEPQLLPKHGTAAISAKTGTGKSFVALHIAQCMVSGQPLFGATYSKTALAGQPMLPVNAQSKVLYIDYEITHDARKARLAAFPNAPNLVFAKMPDMYGLGPEPKRLEALRDLVDKHAPSVLIIDPFSSSHHYDENSSMIRQALSVLNVIRQQFGTAVIIVHHATSKEFRDQNGHKISRDPIEMFRGHSSIVDWCDLAVTLSEVPIVGAPDHIKTLRLSFAKTRHNSNRKPLDITIDWQALTITA